MCSALLQQLICLKLDVIITDTGIGMQCTLSDTLVLGSGSQVAYGPFNPLTAIAISWSTKLSNSTCDTPGNSTTLRPGSVRRLVHQMASPYICRMEVIQKGLRRIILSKFEFHLQNYKCKATHTYVKQKYISLAE